LEVASFPEGHPEQARRASAAATRSDFLLLGAAKSNRYA
jgi:hypothetical protein